MSKGDKTRIEYIRVANYYYKWGLTQDEIAKRINVSRQKINKMLKECIELGIVKFLIPELEETYLKIEALIEEKYNLKSVRICKPINQEYLYSELGNLGSQYLMSIIRNGDTIGFSRGRSVSALVDYIEPKNIKNINVAQLMGGWNNNHTNENSDEIVHRFSKKLNANATMLYFPVVVKSEVLKQEILKEYSYIEAYDAIKSCSIAVVGIGNSKYPELIPTMGEQDYKHIKDKAVGEICTHFYNENGEFLNIPFNNRVISVEYKDYMNIPMRIGVAGSQDKLLAIKGALKGKLVNVLITDLEIAKQLL